MTAIQLNCICLSTLHKHLQFRLTQLSHNASVTLCHCLKQPNFSISRRFLIEDVRRNVRRNVRKSHGYYRGYCHERRWQAIFMTQISELSERMADRWRKWRKDMVEVAEVAGRALLQCSKECRKGERRQQKRTKSSEQKREKQEKGGRIRNVGE